MIVVTGATGFLGSYLTRWLVHQGEQVRGLHRKESPFALVEDIRDSVEWVEADILDVPALAEALHGASQVYHAAATVSFSKKAIPHMMAINMTGTANVVNLCLAQNIPRMLHVSSVAALGRTSEKATISEKTTWERSKYNSPYAISKFRAEREVWRGIQEGLSATIINPSIILGGGFWDRGSASIFKRVAKGERFYPPGSTSYVDVRDVVKAAYLLMQQPPQQERYIITAAQQSFHEILTQIAHYLEVKPPTISAKKWMVQLLRYVESLRSRLTGSEPLITRATINNLFADYTFVNDKLLKTIDFNYRPLAITLRQTALLYQKTALQGYGVLPFEE